MWQVNLGIIVCIIGVVSEQTSIIYNYKVCVFGVCSVIIVVISPTNLCNNIISIINDSMLLVCYLCV